MIRKVSKIKSEEYNNILAPKKPKWNKVKEALSSKIYEINNKFIKKEFKNKVFKEDIKYDMQYLDKEINSLNLFNGIEEKKPDEIKNLIKKIKEGTMHQILSKSNGLSNWSEIKNNQINKGKDIMVQKSKSNLDTKDLNQIINILINEVKNYPRFCDLLKDKEHYVQVFNKLKIIAHQIEKNYINKKNMEEKEINEKLENKRQLEALNQKLVEEENKTIRLQKEIEERKKQEEERIRREEEKEKIRRDEEKQKRGEEERKRREEEEKKRREEEKKRREREIGICIPRYFPIPNYGGCSIVDALKSICVNSSYNYRCLIAARNGIGGYNGTPEQNIYMLNLLKSGKLLRPKY